MDPRLLDLVWEAYQSVGAPRLHPRRLRLPLAGHQFDAAQPLQGRGREEPAHARQGHGLLHPRRQPEEAARDRPEDAGRRRRLLSALRLALRAYRRRQCAPLAEDEPQGTGRAVPERQDAACAERRQAAARLRAGARLLQVAQEERHHRPGAGQRRPSVKTRTGGLLAALFGGGADEEEDNSSGEEVAVASVRAAGKFRQDRHRPAGTRQSRPTSAARFRRKTRRRAPSSPRCRPAAFRCRASRRGRRPMSDRPTCRSASAEDAPFKYPEQPPVELADAKIPFPTCVRRRRDVGRGGRPVGACRPARRRCRRPARATIRSCSPA